MRDYVGEALNTRDERDVPLPRGPEDYNPGDDAAGLGKASTAIDRGFTLFADLSAQSSKEMLVDKLLGAGEASTWYGKPGDGKSVLAEDLGLHVSAGLPWLGRPVRRGAVMYIALERKKLVERRAIAFRERHNPGDLPFAIVGGVHDFRDRRTVDGLIKIAREIETATGETLVLIVVDTLSRALCGGDENSPKDMGAVVAATSLLQQRTGAHVLWVHHMPQDGGERMRGHGALLGAMDTTLHVAKAGEVRTATVVKANDSEEGEQVAFTLESVVIGRDRDSETTAPVVVAADAWAAKQSTRAGTRMPKAAQTALRALTEAVDEQGTAAPASNHIPAAAKVVSVIAWRQQAYRRGISTSDEERAKQQAFKRAADHLIGSGRVGIWDQSVWIA